MTICTYSNNNLCKLWSLWLESISAISFENCLGDSMMKHGWQSICLQAGQIHSPSHWHWFGMFFWSCPVKRKMSSIIIYIIMTYKKYDFHWYKDNTGAYLEQGINSIRVPHTFTFIHTTILMLEIEDGQFWRSRKPSFKGFYI